MSLKSWIIWQGKDIGYGILSKIFWPRNSAAALVVKEDKVLAIDTGDYLMLPGGGQDKGESFEQAAVREAREETGYDIELVERIQEKMNSVGGTEVIFKAKLTGEQEADGNWEGKPVWLTREEAESRRWRHDRDIEEILERVL